MSDRKRAKTPQDLPDRAQVLAVSGLEFMERLVAGTWPGAPMADTLGFHVTAAAPGEVTFRGAPPFSATNPVGAVHGGWYGTLLDSCMGCAVMTRVPKGAHYTTLEFKVNILRALPVGCEVEAVGRVQHAGRSTGVATGEVRGLEDGRLYATGSTTCIIMGAARET